MTDERVHPLDCRRAREAVHEILDGDLLPPERESWLDGHLAGCEGCRHFRDDMLAMQEALRNLPQESFPEAALTDVRARTTADGRGQAGRSWRLDWRSFAAAAVLTGAAFGLWQWSRPTAPTDPVSTVGMIVIDPERLRTDPEYARRIAEETVRVLSLTSDALTRTERAAVHGVLGGQVSRALGRVPIRWPEADPQAKKKTERENEL